MLAVNIFYSIKTIFTLFQPWSGDTVVTAITKMADFGANIFKMDESADFYHWEALAPPHDSAGAGAAAVCAAQSVVSWVADQSSVTLISINF